MSKPKTPKPPPPPPPEAIPDKMPETGENEIRRIRRQQGYQKQILTGALAPSVGKKTLLG